MTEFEKIEKKLKDRKYTWLITGVAGFIGSNLLEYLLKNEQNVIGLDNFATGTRKNLNEVKKNITKEQYKNFIFIKGDIKNLNDCRKSMQFEKFDQNKMKATLLKVDFVLHHAALGSVPRSIKEPAKVNEVNISGFLNILIAAQEKKVKKIIYAASSSTYGDLKELPKKENKIGKPLSPYAVTKYVNELYAEVFNKCYGINTIGLRYFNVFGERQNPKGEYAAVIPNWINSIIKGEKIYINGDGTTSRDFCYVKNVVQANVLAALNGKKINNNQIFNIAIGERTSLSQIIEIIKKELNNINYKYKEVKIIKREFRDGDIKHSQADISKAKNLLKYNPTDNVNEGLKKTIKWQIENERKNK